MATSADDTEDGDDSADRIDLLGGNDYANGFGGADTIRGGTGDDVIIGGSGNDSLSGDSGVDVLTGEDGNDSLYGGSGEDELDGGTGADRIDAGDQDDYAVGADGADTIIGGSGNDILQGDEGHDSLLGGSGNDTLEGGYGNDRLEGQDGDDEIFELSGINTILAGAGSDFIEGGNEADSIDAGSGDDTLTGGFGNDTLIGQLGDDYLEGGEGIDTAVFAKKAADVQATYDGYSFKFDLSTTETDEVVQIESFVFLDRTLSAQQFAVERGLANLVFQVSVKGGKITLEELLESEEPISDGSQWVIKLNGIWSTSFTKRASDWLEYLQKQFPADLAMQSLTLDAIFEYFDKAKVLPATDITKQQAAQLASMIADVQVTWSGTLFDGQFGPSRSKGWMIQSTGEAYELVWSEALDYSIQGKNNLVLQADGVWNPHFVEQTAKALEWLAITVNPLFASWSVNDGLSLIQGQLSASQQQRETPNDLVNLVGQIADADFKGSPASLPLDYQF